MEFRGAVVVVQKAVSLIRGSWLGFYDDVEPGQQSLAPPHYRRISPAGQGRSDSKFLLDSGIQNRHAGPFGSLRLLSSAGR